MSDEGIVACVEIGGVGAVFRCVFGGFVSSFFFEVLIFLCCGNIVYSYYFVVLPQILRL